MRWRTNGLRPVHAPAVDLPATPGHAEDPATTVIAFTTTRAVRSEIPVRRLPLAHLEHQDEETVVEDLEEDPEVPDVEGVDGRPGDRCLQLLDMAARVVPDPLQRPDHAPSVLPLELLQVLIGPRRIVEPIPGHSTPYFRRISAPVTIRPALMSSRASSRPAISSSVRGSGS